MGTSLRKYMIKGTDKMKRLASLILVCTVMLCALPACATAEASSAGLMQRIYAANRTEALKLRHAAMKTHMSGAGGIDYEVYWDSDYQIESNPSVQGYYGIRVTCGRYDYIVQEDGEFRRCVSLDTWMDQYQLFNEDILLEEVLSTEEADGALVVTTAAETDEAAEYYAGVRSISIAGEEKIYAVDPETMELLSWRWEAVFPDGTREVYREITVEHEAERPHQDAIDAIEARLAEAPEMRTTTFVYDEGTPTARTYVFTSPVGELIHLWGFDQFGIHYEIDPDRSIPTNEARDNDAVYYLVRVEE